MYISTIQLGCKVGDFQIERKDHVFTQVSEQTKFCLHFYAKQLEESEFKRVEEKAIKGHDYGHEVCMCAVVLLLLQV